MGITICVAHQYLVEMANDAYLRLVDRESEHCWYALVRCIARGQGNRAGFTQGRNKAPVSLFMAQNTLCQLNVMAKVKCLISISLYHPLRENGDISGIV